MLTSWRSGWVAAAWAFAVAALRAAGAAIAALPPSKASKIRISGEENREGVMRSVLVGPVGRRSERHPGAGEEARQPAGCVGVGQGALAGVGDACVGDAQRGKAVVAVDIGRTHITAQANELFALVERQ